MKRFDMTPIFPRLPKDLTTKELRKEIRRRLKIMDQMGLVKKWFVLQKLDLVHLAKSTH